MRVAVTLIIFGALGTFPKGFRKYPKWIGNQRKNLVRLDQSDDKISLSSEVTVKDYQLTLVKIPRKELSNCQLSAHVHLILTYPIW